jgi:hypothetical protein
MRGATSAAEIAGDESPEAPNPKHQAPKKSQAPNFKEALISGLLFRISGLFGGWDLGFGISRQRPLTRVPQTGRRNPTTEAFLVGTLFGRAVQGAGDLAFMTLLKAVARPLQ